MRPPADADLRIWDEACRSIAGRVPAGAPCPRVFVEAWHQPPRAAQEPVPGLIRLAGGEPFIPTPGSLNHDVTWEEVMEFNPQVVLLSFSGVGTQAPPEQWLAIEGWDRVDAAAQGFVFSVDDSLWLRPGLELLEGARLLQALIGECCWGWPRVRDVRVRRLSGS